MLDFVLKVSSDGINYNNADLFPDQELDFEIDFYDSLSIDSIKMPFFTDIKLPLTTNNQSSNVFNFNVDTSSGADFPRSDFFFELNIFDEAGVVTSLSGILNVRSFEYNSSEPYIQVELKDQISHYLSKSKNVNISELYTQTDYTTDYQLLNFVRLAQGGTVAGGQAGVIGAHPDPDAAIIFPYVDMNNDLDSAGYAQRAFMEYGTGRGRTAFVPAFSVTKFLEYLGEYLTAQTIDVRVDSKLFGVGEFDGNPYDSTMAPERLRFINTSHMLAKQSVNTRTFTVEQALAWVGTNISMNEIYGTFKENKDFRTNYWGSMEISGNAGGVSSDIWAQANWGAKRNSTSYPTNSNDSVRGWFCPKISYKANLRLNGNPTSVTIARMDLEIPVTNEDEMVSDISASNTTATFTPYVGIYEDGMMLKKIALQDSNGDALELSPTGRAFGNSNKTDSSSLGNQDYIHSNGDKALVNETGSGIFDTLKFENITAYFPSDVDIEVNGGSRYSVNYFLEPVDGTVQVTTVDTFVSNGGTVMKMATESVKDKEVYELKKLITRIPTLTEAAKLDVTFRASEDFLPHNTTDLINIQDSIAQTTTDTIYDTLLAICKRFNCNLLYDYDTATSEHILRVDPLHIARSGSENVYSMADDAVSIKLSEGGSKVKNLSLINEDYDAYYDDEDNDGVTVGSTTQSINEDAAKDLDVKFDSSIFFKSVCGEEAVDRPANLESGAFSSEQLGLASNIHALNKDIGLRFAFVQPQNYTTNILHPFIVYNEDITFSGNMKTETERIYTLEAYDNGGSGFGELSNNNARMIFNGQLTHVNGQGWDLRAEDEDGNTTDYYELYSEGEALLMANNSVIEFGMVVTVDKVANLDFFLQTLTAPNITPNNIFVKSAKGKVYGDFVYLTIEALID